MVAKVENNKPSTWLEKTSGGQSRFGRWVWVLAVLLVLAIIGASVLGWYVTKDSPDHGAPTAVGGKENEKPVPTTTSTLAVGNLGGSTRFHVSPTLTVAKRGPSYTGVANIAGTHPSHQHKRLRRGISSH